MVDAQIFQRLSAINEGRINSGKPYKLAYEQVSSTARFFFTANIEFT